MNFKTKKAAREAGYLAEHTLRSKRLAPQHDAEPIIIKGEAFYHRSKCDRLISQTEARRRRLLLPDGISPVATFRAMVGLGGRMAVQYDAYRESDCVPMRSAARRIPPVEIDLLRAIFTANKAAKRYRDSAQSNYQCGQHGFAGYAKATKERLYALKDRGIAEAYRQGRISFVGVHGNMGLYRGEGYCFHSTLVPSSHEPVEDQQEPVFVDAAPKGAKEARLKDAVRTLALLDDDMAGFRMLSRPALAQAKRERFRTYWSDDENDCECDDDDDDIVSEDYSRELRRA